MKTAITNTVITFCYLMTMVPLHAEELTEDASNGFWKEALGLHAEQLTEAQEARNNRIFGQCMMDHYGQKTNEKGGIDFLHIDSRAFVNCLKCKKHTGFISADGGENCNE